MREDETGEQPVRVFTGSRIEPLDGTRPEAFAVRGERVAATGSRAELADRFPAVERVDLDGALVVPGFNDAHCHTSQAALARVRVDVSDARTADEVLAALRARAALVPPGEWVVGQGLHEDALSGRVDRDLLDRASAEHPVVVIQYTFHRAVANTAALERIGYRTEADAPSGGQLLTTADGRLDGWMYERAWLDPWLPGSGRESIAPGGEPSAQLAALREVNTELHRLGITSYCDAIVTPLEQEMYAAAHRLGQLTPRVSMLLWHSYFDPRAWPAEQPDAHRLQLAGVKLMLDGALSGGTCLCRQPYPSATGGDNGLQVLDDAGFQRTVRSVHAAGARVAVHANGDLAITRCWMCWSRWSTRRRGSGSTTGSNTAASRTRGSSNGSGRPVRPRSRSARSSRTSARPSNASTGLSGPPWPAPTSRCSTRGSRSRAPRTSPSSPSTRCRRSAAW